MKCISLLLESHTQISLIYIYISEKEDNKKGGKISLLSFVVVQNSLKVVIYVATSLKKMTG